MDRVYLRSIPIFVNLREGVILQPLEIEVNDGVIEEGASSQCLVILHGYCHGGYTLNTLRILAQVLERLDNRLGRFRWRLVG